MAATLERGGDKKARKSEVREKREGEGKAPERIITEESLITAQVRNAVQKSCPAVWLKGVKVKRKTIASGREVKNGREREGYLGSRIFLKSSKIQN